MNVTVYCGASKGTHDTFEKTAIAMGRWIAENDHTLVYGGGKAGLMGIVADTTLKFGGEVIGIIPTFLKHRELAHSGITELRVVESMADRKKQMADLGDAFVALPGGPGTLEEITEMVSWARIGQNSNPCIFFDTDSYYEPLRKLYDNMVACDFLTVEDREKILFSDSFDEIDLFIKNYTAPLIRKY